MSKYIIRSLIDNIILVHLTILSALAVVANLGNAYIVWWENLVAIMCGENVWTKILVKTSLANEWINYAKGY